MIISYCRVKFNCTAATVGTHHVMHLILPTRPPRERMISKPYGIYGKRSQFLLRPCQCVIHYSTENILF